MWMGRGRECAKSRMASWIMVTASAAEVTRRDTPTIALTAADGFLVSCSEPMSRKSCPTGRPGESRIMGRDSAYAVAAPDSELSRPGPEVVMTTPGSPRTWDQPSAP